MLFRSLKPPVFDGENFGTVPSFALVATPEGDKGPADFDVQVAHPDIAADIEDGDIDSLLTDCLELVHYVANPLGSKFPSHPKTTPAWWAGLRILVDDLQPRLLAALEA